MSHRDELAAALVRVEALEREVAQLKESDGPALTARLRRLVDAQRREKALRELEQARVVAVLRKERDGFAAELTQLRGDVRDFLEARPGPMQAAARARLSRATRRDP